MSCEICMDEDTAPKVALKPCGHVMCVICARAWRRQTRECPFCRRTVTHTEGDRSGDDTDVGLGSLYPRVWLYKSTRNEDAWWLFDAKRQRLLNELLASGKRTATIEIGPVTVELDLDQMQQTCAQTGTVRAIKWIDDAAELERLGHDIRGVAGVSRVRKADT